MAGLARSDSKQEDQEKPEEHLYKILVIGDFGVGKTSIIRRYTEDIFSPNYKLTIGVDFSLKSLEWSSNLNINLQLWDIAGHERFGHMTRVYYKYAIGAIIVFDLTRQVTFESVLKWLGDVNQKVALENGDPVPIMILANKCDLDNPQVEASKIDDLCSKHSLLGWFPTSAKEGKNISKAMESLVEKILELKNREPELPVDVVDLGTDNIDGNYTVTEPYSNSSYNNSNDGYSKVVGMKGLVRNVGQKSEPEPQHNACCS